MLTLPWSIVTLLAVALIIEHYTNRTAVSSIRRAHDLERSELIKQISRLSLAKSLPEYDSSNNTDTCVTWGPNERYPAEEDGPEIAMPTTIWE